MPSKNLRVSYGQSVYDEKEIKRVIKVLREKRSNLGVETLEFERRVAEIFGTKYGVMVNSGSSANLLAVELSGLKPGDEVITPILTFSTTISPLIQKGVVIDFVDVDLNTFQINAENIEKLITKKTKGLMIPLLLGNSPDLIKIHKLAKKYKLKLIIDSCDMVGVKYDNKPVSSYSELVTTSFFGSHIITAGGNGGMLLTNNKLVANRARVLRGWGRSSSIFGETEDIKKRFSLKIGGLQYDAKFIFQDLGYNLLPMEIGSAFGNEQLNKLLEFKKVRKTNFNFLYKFFSEYPELFYLPTSLPKTQTTWHVFPLLIKDTRINRIKLMTFLEKNNIQTRPIFTGNILKQPGFNKIMHTNKTKKFPNADYIMKYGLLIGAHHGMEKKHLEKLAKVFKEFLLPFSVKKN